MLARAGGLHGLGKTARVLARSALAARPLSWPPGRASSSAAGRRWRSGPAPAQAMANMACEFEVHGIVQGVFFRAYTTDKAKSLALVGYCMNTHQGTVKGEVQGRAAAVEEMKVWLATTGSPHSVIERCDFSNERELDELEYASFGVRRR